MTTDESLPVGGLRVALVVKRTKWNRYRDQQEKRVEELLAAGDPSVANLKAAHEEHVSTLAEARQALAACGADAVDVDAWGDSFDAAGFDLVVTVGGDGTLLHTSHLVGHTPVLAVNSAPSYSVGFFCGARRGEVERALRAVLSGELPPVSLTRMTVAVNGEVVAARVLNDALFCHRSPAATSRYILEHDGHTEEHRSSGFWVGPAAGSTAAQRSAGGRVLPLACPDLQLVVREPYVPEGVQLRLQLVRVQPGSHLFARSKSRRMRMYFDGPEKMVKLGLGDVVSFTQSPEPFNLLGMPARRWDELRRPAEP